MVSQLEKYTGNIDISVILRKKYFEFFDNKVEYRIDPVRSYGVKYDQTIMMGYKGQQKQVVFGVTKSIVPEWKITLLKNAHRGVSILNDHDFVVHNVVAFYWIHQWRFELKDATIDEIAGVMGWFAKKVIDSNKSIGIKLAYVTKRNMGEYGLIVQQAFELIRDKTVLDQFAVLTNIFPKDTISRRALKTKLLRDKWFELIDLVRWDMDINQKWLDEPILDEFNSAVQQKSGIGMLSKYRLGLYWDQGLGVTFKQRMAMWLQEVISMQDINSIEQLSQGTGLSMYKLKSILGSKYEVIKKQLKTHNIIRLLEVSTDKSQIIKLSGISRSSLYRKISSDPKLKQLWDKL